MPRCVPGRFMPNRAIPYVKVVVHLLCLLPFLNLVQMYRSGALANYADPTNFITHFTGDWALWLLLTTLAVTPVRRIHKSLGWLVRLRRMIGLYAFFYASLHLATYVFLFSGYDVTSAWAGVKAGHVTEPLWQLKLVWPTMLNDAEKRRFIQVGLLAWVMLLALAVTSPQAVLIAMGGKTWRGIHRLIYAAGILAVVHYWWLVKTGVKSPMLPTVILAVLLLARVVLAVMKRMPRRAPEAAVSSDGGA